MGKRAAMGLSIETLVVIIISLVILAGGITLLYKFVYGAEEVKGILDERTDQALENILLNEGKEVAVPYRSAVVPRGQSYVFGLGILNSRDTQGTFKIEAEFDKAVKANNEIINNANLGDVNQWLLYDTRDMLIKASEHRKEAIEVIVPETAEPGTYIFNLNVLDVGTSERYGNQQKIYVQVQ